MVCAFQDHLTFTKLAFNHKQLATVGEPTLMPQAARRIVDAEALTFQAGIVFVQFPQSTAIEHTLHSHVRNFCRAGEFEYVPVAQQEIKLVVLSGRTGSRGLNRECSDRVAHGCEQQETEKQDQHQSEYFAAYSQFLSPGFKEFCVVIAAHSALRF